MAKTAQNLIQKPPVVVVMGHIDHGKTSLLLSIRKLNFSAGKPGGAITQHVGAYQVERNGKKITFLDTPGHEAFSQMRSRGAKVADIAVLVVAADEGVKSQTKEAISHIKKADIPVILAINKTDKPEADSERVKRELAKEQILVESMSGKVPSVEVSAKTGKGVEELLELILLVAEMENLRTDLLTPVQGVVIESYLDARRGPVATLILNQGKLKPRQVVGTFSAVGKIRSLEDFQGNSITEALPSQPALALGFETPPIVGEELKVFPDMESARSNLKTRGKSARQITSAKPSQNALNLVLKADTLGSLEALEGILKELPQEEVALRILKSEAGQITESDIKIAKHSKALVLGFRVKMNSTAQRLLQREKVKVIQFDIIYDLVEAVRKYMEKLLQPALVRTDLGKMKVLVIFLTDKNRQIVGGKITEGQIKKGVFVEIIKAGEVAGKGKIINLQRNKKDIDLASKGEEVGILYEGNAQIEVGDTLVIFHEERKKGEL